jgi:hypothetical protein
MINLLEDIKYFFIIAKRNIVAWFSKFKKLGLSQYMLIALCAAGLVFVLSIVLFYVDKGLVSRRVFFFPDTFSFKLRGEERFITNAGNSFEDVRKVVEELLLGPANPDVFRVFPQGTTLISMVAKERDLYLNFSSELLLKDNLATFPLEKRIMSCINTIRFNFPDLKKIYFFIHGEELAIQVQNPKGEKVPLESVGFSDSLLQ